MRARRSARPYGRSFFSFDLFTLFCECRGPVNRSKPQGGERVGAEIETQVYQAAYSPGSRAATGGAPGNPRPATSALAQAPPGDDLTLVNAEREFVERKGGGEFVARPVFDRKIVDLFYAVRDADTGDWISAMYRVKGGEKKRSDGWEYSWEYPDLDEHPELDRDRAYLLVMLAVAEDGKRGEFYAVVPIHQPGRIWDKILSALSPARWARAFAGWMIEGVHGTLCGVVERASGEDADNCRRESGR